MKRNNDIFFERQFGWLFSFLMIGFLVFFFLLYFFRWGDSSLPMMPFVIIVVSFVIILLLLFKMDTYVDDRLIKIRYGVGLIRKTILIDNIESVRVVRGRWIQGAGLRFTGRGSLYNINFTNNIELRLKNSRRTICIGSSQPEQLCDAVNQRMGSNNLNRQYQ